MELIFPYERTSDGFSTSSTAGQEKGRAEPVVRELLQNRLDARNQDRVDVVFTIDEIPQEQIPCLEDYQQTYTKAREQREAEAVLSAPDQNICARIDNVLESPKTKVLFCRDNGNGLSKDTMNRLLSEGNTSKTKGGAGSVGVGHLTAFAASDLRYIVYGGKTAEGFCGSGRALLAAWLDKENQKTRSTKGTLAKDVIEQISLFDSGFIYLNEPPAFLEKQMATVADTGTVISVLGFDWFGHKNKEEVATTILKIAASHFLPAVMKGRMTVSVRTGRTLRELDSSGVGNILDPRQITRTRGIELPEGLAYRSWRTIEDGKAISNALGAEIRFRPLEQNERYTRVNFYRDGMWITWEAPWVTGFGGYQPFDAAVMVEPGNELYTLIRDSEGATHYHINQDNLADNSKRNKLKKLLTKITTLLKEEAEEISEEEYIPTGFAAFGTGEKQAEIVTPTARTRATLEDPGREGGRGPDVDGGGKSNNGNGSDNEEPKPKVKPARPKRGRPAQIKKSARIEQQDGLITALTISVDSNPHPAVGVRVVRETGSDETCDRQLGSQFYRIKPADDRTAATDPWEVRWEGGTGIFAVTLDPPRPAVSGVPAVDLVVRR